MKKNTFYFHSQLDFETTIITLPYSAVVVFGAFVGRVGEISFSRVVPFIKEQLD